MSETRTFLFLQGPPGPLFRRLGDAMRQRGVAVHRINICGGDQRDWKDSSANFRGRFSDWPTYFDRYLRDNAVTDLMVFGDCRPYHVSALGIAQLRGVRTHVIEEGYLRPDWMTLEPEAVNAGSTLPREKEWFLREAARLPEQEELPPITASFRRRARDSYWHYHSVVMGRLLRSYPHYRSHRPNSIIIEGAGWLWKFASEGRRARRTAEVLRRLESEPLFVFPLQLSTDYQIRTHSLFPDMQSAATYVIESFAANAPPGVHLLLKSHPLDSSFFNWRKFVQRLARRLDVEGRVHLVDGGNLEQLAQRARGLVCVNSTSATLALAHDTPVCTVGEAIYDMPGLTHQGHLDTFWTNPTPPEPGVYAAFRRVLVDRCLVRGGLASESAVQVLIDSILDRLEVSAAPEAAVPASAEEPLAALKIVSRPAAAARSAAKNRVGTLPPRLRDRPRQPARR